MEQGTSVVIRSNLLVFEEDGQTIFTKNSIVVDNPGGDATTGFSLYKIKLDPVGVDHFDGPGPVRIFVYSVPLTLLEYNDPT